MPPEQRTDAVQWVIERQIGSEPGPRRRRASSSRTSAIVNWRVPLPVWTTGSPDQPMSINGVCKSQKLELAEEPWPELQREIERALRHETHRKIPIVDATLPALEIAAEWSRPGFVIPIVHG